MSVVGDIMSALKNVIVLTDQVDGLTEEVRKLSAELRDVDRRLARLEGAFSFATRTQQAAPQLKGPEEA